VGGQHPGSAGMRQFAAEDGSAAGAQGKPLAARRLRQLGIDPDARRRCGWPTHPGVPHTRPSKEVVLRSGVKQFQSGEGAIPVRPFRRIAPLQCRPAATAELRSEFIEIYVETGPRRKPPLAQPPSPRDQEPPSWSRGWDVMGSILRRKSWELISTATWPKNPPQPHRSSRPSGQAMPSRALAWRGPACSTRFRGEPLPPEPAPGSDCGRELPTGLFDFLRAIAFAPPG